jgi:hypothetical protein
MKRIGFRRPSPPMVVALVALLAALAGTSYAAVQLPANSVGTKQLKKNAVTGKKVKNRSLKAADFAAGQLPQGEKGEKGDKGDPGAPGGAANVTEIVETVPNSAASDDEWNTFAVATCPEGQRVISGGFFQDVQSLGEVYGNVPDEDGTAWIVVAVNWADPEGDFTDGELNALAYCVPSPQASKAPLAERRAAAIAQAKAIVAKYHKQRR